MKKTTDHHDGLDRALGEWSLARVNPLAFSGIGGYGRGWRYKIYTCKRCGRKMLRREKSFRVSFYDEGISPEMTYTVLECPECRWRFPVLGEGEVLDTWREG